jgi:PAS domain S-box-containing protein/putative nucleotidyltransferase with HDIG domain
MKISTKILLITLPAVLLSILLGIGITYQLSRTALMVSAEKWLDTLIPQAEKTMDRYEQDGDTAFASAAFLNTPTANRLPADLRLRQVQASAELLSLPVGKQGFVFVVDSQGTVIIHPDPKMVGADVSQGDWFTQIQRQGQGRLTFQWLGVSYLALYRFFQGWGWYVLVADPTREVYGAIEQAELLALAAGLVCILASALILILGTRRLTGPLTLLAAGAAQIGQGNLTVHIPVTTKDEIGNLADVFNHMAVQLQDTLQALQSSEKHFRTLIENSSDMILVLDFKGTVIYAAPSMQTLGYTPMELTGRPVFDFIHPEDIPATAQAFTRLVERTGSSPPIQIRVRHKKGDWHTLEAVGKNLLADPSVAGVVINCRDLEERERAEKVQKAIYRISEAAIQAQGLEELFTAINRIISELMPAKNFYVALYDPEEDLLRFPYYIDEYDQPPPPVKPNKGLTEYVLRTNEPLLATPDKFDELVARGEVEPVGANSIDWLGVPLRLAGRAIGVLVVQSYSEEVRFREQDKEILTFVCEQAAMSIARKQAEAAEREKEQRYRDIFENSPISLWEEDFSEIKAYLDDLRRQGIRDFRKFFDLHPEAVIECTRLIKVLDVNQATLRLVDAECKTYLLDNLEQVFGGASNDLIRDELVAIAEGRLEFEGSGSSNRLSGGRIDFVLRWSISPVYAASLKRIIVSVTDITERNRSEARVQSQIRRLNSLRAIDASITGSLDLRATLNVLLEQVTRELEVDAAAVLLLDPQILTLEYAAGIGFQTAALKHTRLRMGEGYAGRAAMEGRLVRVANLHANPGELGASELLLKEGFISYFAMPLIAKGVVKGVLEIFHRTELNCSEEWLDFLETLGGQAAIAIDNASLFNDLQHTNLELTLAYDATIEGWSRALDLRDRETEGHTQRVTELTLRLALLMGVSKAALVHLRWGALLHDIGKMAIPDSILLKAGPLNPEEREIMRRHPIHAYDMLKSITYLRQAIEIPYYHHERWNGRGYPCRLQGEEIPLAARIFSVVDVWDALRSDRPYRRAWQENKVRQYLRLQAGRLFDPAIVDAFLTMQTGRDKPGEL